MKLMESGSVETAFTAIPFQGVDRLPAILTKSAEFARKSRILAKESGSVSGRISNRSAFGMDSPIGKNGESGLYVG
jgi:hypothetical protein